MVVTWSQLIVIFLLTGYFWSVFSCIQSKYRKIQTRNDSVFGQFFTQWLQSGMHFFIHYCFCLFCIILLKIVSEVFHLKDNVGWVSNILDKNALFITFEMFNAPLLYDFVSGKRDVFFIFLNLTKYIFIIIQW